VTYRAKACRPQACALRCPWPASWLHAVSGAKSPQCRCVARPNAAGLLGLDACDERPPADHMVTCAVVLVDRREVRRCQEQLEGPGIAGLDHRMEACTRAISRDSAQQQMVPLGTENDICDAKTNGARHFIERAPWTTQLAKPSLFPAWTSRYASRGEPASYLPKRAHDGVG